MSDNLEAEARSVASEIVQAMFYGDVTPSDHRELITEALLTFNRKAVDSLATELATLKEKLKYTCGVCWTNSFEPADKDDPEAIETDDGQYLSCAHCKLKEAYINAV